MSEQDIKKLIELDIIEQEELLKSLERQQSGYVVNSKGVVSAFNLDKKSWGRKPLLFSMILSEVCFIITLFLTIAGLGGTGGRIFWLIFTILFFAFFVASLIILEVQQANWNHKYHNLCDEIERVKTKLKSDKKKLEALKTE